MPVQASFRGMTLTIVTKPPTPEARTAACFSEPPSANFPQSAGSCSTQRNLFPRTQLQSPGIIRPTAVRNVLPTRETWDILEHGKGSDLSLANIVQQHLTNVL